MYYYRKLDKINVIYEHDNKFLNIIIIINICITIKNNFSVYLFKCCTRVEYRNNNHELNNAFCSSFFIHIYI